MNCDVRSEQCYKGTCYNRSRVARKHILGGFRLQKMAVCLKIRIYEVEGNVCSENKATEELCSNSKADLRLCFKLTRAEGSQGELIVYPLSCRLCVCVFTLSKMNISQTSGPIATKFYLKHWGGGKAALGFGPDRIRTLVSMTTNSSHRVIMGKICQHSSAFIFDQIFVILAGNEDNYNISDEFGIRPDQPRTAELATLEHLEKSP